MGKDNRRWEDFGDREDTTVISDDTIKRTKIRNGENSNYKNAADEYERQARARDDYERLVRRSAERDRRLNTNGGDRIYDGYERSGMTYDRHRNYSYNNWDQYYNDYQQDPYGGGQYGNGYYGDQQGQDPYGGAVDDERAMRARNLAREAQYKDLRAQQDELRRLREEGTKENRQRRGRHPKNDRKARKKAQKAAARAAKKKGGFGRKIRKLIAILLILLLVFSGYFLILCSHFDKVDTGNSDFAIDPGVEDSLGGFLSGYRNIAVLGSDARSNEPLDGSRTDAIIILSIKRSNGDINMISIMRDSFLKQENSEHDLILDKITHAHHWAGGVGTVAALNRSLDLNIKEYIIFNWQAVADTVDALGGITVDIQKNEIRDLNKWGPETGRNVGREYKSITSTGVQEIDGVQATTYCRIRKTSGGDPGRGNRYKKVMAAVMKKAITSPWKLNSLANDVFPNIRTNMSGPAMLGAVLRAPGYDIKKSYGWPKKYYGGILSSGLWYAVPRTLEWNVKWLHKNAFGQDDYNVSDTCREISNEIIYQTGVQ